jgi:HD-like signal output (HDOD) protein
VEDLTTLAAVPKSTEKIMPTDISNYESILKDLSIPPRPEALTRIFAEMSQDDPDLNRVGKIVQSDPAMTAGVLQVANSPLLGLNRKVGSISQALSLLGLKNISNIATGVAIRQSLKGGGDGKAFQSFWDAAEKTALISAYLATQLRGIASDVAFTFGLFHDCGVPLLMMRFPRYKATLAKAKTQGSGDFTTIEEADTGTSHSILGYFLAKSWGLPDELCQGVLLHHDLSAFKGKHTPGGVRSLIGLVHLAEYMQSRVMGNSGDADWIQFEEPIMEHFGLGEEDVANLSDAIAEALHIH